MQSQTRTACAILIVEDNRDAADSLAEFLRMNGFSVRVAYTGPTGVAEAIAHPPDAILCDINLPGLDGFGVARELRSALSVMPVIVAVTACQEEDLVRPAADAGFDFYFVKPASPVEICGFLCDRMMMAH